MNEVQDFSTLSAEEIAARVIAVGKSITGLFPWERIVPLQSRAETNQGLIAEYGETLKNGARMPESKGVFVPGENICYLYDGIHTGQARRNLGQEAIPVRLQLGTKTDADIAASGANSTHGARRSNADKRRSVELLLRNPELASRSNKWLSETAHVSPQLVEDVRLELENDPANPVARPKKTKVKRGNSEYEAKTPDADVGNPEPEKVAQRVVSRLDKLLKPYPLEEQASLCELTITAIRNYAVGHYNS